MGWDLLVSGVVQATPDKLRSSYSVMTYHKEGPACGKIPCDPTSSEARPCQQSCRDGLRISAWRWFMKTTMYQTWTDLVTCSHHLNPRFWSGGFLLNGSIEPSIYKLSSRAPRFFARTRAYFITYCPDTDSLCCQHLSCFFTDIDRCISISVHLISTRTAINSFG